MERAQNWRFGSSLSIKDQISVTGLLVGNTESGLSVRPYSSLLFWAGIECLSRLASAVTILGMPLTTLLARNDIVTVNTFSSYFTLSPDYSPDRCVDFPRRLLDLHGDQPSLHLYSLPVSCIPSTRHSRGRRSRRRRSPCHILRAQCWYFPASSSLLLLDTDFYDS